MSGASVGGRVVAFLAPIPFVTLHFQSEAVALWFVILTFQAFATSVIGVLPTVLMHMVSFANAGSDRLGNHLTQDAGTASGDPNLLLLSKLARGLVVTFATCAVIWIVLAATLGTAVIWRPLQASGIVLDGSLAWAIFILASACRLYMQAYAAYLLGRGFVAQVRRLEAITWTIGGLVSAASLAVFPSFVLAMALLQLPMVVYLVLLRRKAIAEGWQPASAEVTRDLNLRKELLPRALRGGVGAFMSYVAVYGSALVYAQVGEAESVAAFAFALNIFGIIGQLAITPLYASLPALSHLLAKRDLPRQNAIAQVAMFRGLLVYAVLVPAVPLGVYVTNLLLPKSLLMVEIGVWSLLAIANFLFRYGAMHLHYYTITNDIRWHIVDGINAMLFLGLLAFTGLLEGLTVSAFPICQAMALALFYVPYARRLTWRHFQFGLSRDFSYAAVPAALAAASLIVFQAF